MVRELIQYQHRAGRDYRLWAGLYRHWLVVMKIGTRWIERLMPPVVTVR